MNPTCVTTDSPNASDKVIFVEPAIYLIVSFLIEAANDSGSLYYS